MSDELQTINPDQLAQTSAVSEDAFVLIQRPGQPIQKIAWSALLAKLIKTDLLKADRATLYADLAHDADAVALVDNDPDPLKNGWYRKTGASGAGAWTQFEQLAAAVREAIEETRDESEAAALVASSAAAGALGVLAAAPKNAGKGIVSGTGTGPNITFVAPNLSRAFGIYAVNPDGSLGATMFAVNTRLGRVDFLATYASSATAERTRSVRFEMADTTRPKAISAQFIAAPPPNVRVAWGFAGFFADTKDNVLRAPFITRSTEASPAGALVHRGGVVGFGRITRPTQFQCPTDAYIIMAQGAAMRSKGLRTHQQCPSMAMSGRYFYVAFSAANETLGGDYHQAEGPNSYVAICRRPISGGAWEEVAQALPSGTSYRVSDPMIQMIDGRLAVFLPFGMKGSDTEHYTQGVYVSFLENPDAPVGGRLAFTNPVFTGSYGFASTGFFEKGQFNFVSYIPMGGYPTGQYWEAAYATIGINHVPPGGYLSRFVPGGAPGAPFVERLSRIPGEATTATETYTEPQIIRLHKTLGATYDFWLTTRSTAGPREAFGTENADGTITWTPLTACTKFNASTVSVRRRVIRSQRGNVIAIVNGDTVNRRAMTVFVSQDEAATFPVSLIVESASQSSPHWSVSYPDAVSYVDPTTGRSKIALVYDEGRGTGASLPANFWFHILDEADLISGALTTAASVAARELVSQLEYTG